MTLAANNFSFAFLSPGACCKDNLDLSTSSIRRTPEEALGDEMVFGGVAATVERRTRVRTAFAMEPASTNCAMLGHGSSAS